MPKYKDFLAQQLENNRDILLLTAENRAPFRGLEDTFSDRIIDVGIAEQAMVGMAAGLALRGRRPIVHALAAFLSMRAFEFIRTDIGYPGLPVVLMGTIAGVLSECNGPTHQALEDIALMRGIPGMGVFCPAHEGELTEGLEQILTQEQPFYVRYNDRPDTYTSDYQKSSFELGNADVWKNHSARTSEVTILTYGVMCEPALECAGMLCAENITTEVINLHTLIPLDNEAVLKACAQSTLCVTLEDHFLTGGLYSIVAELLLQSHITARVSPIAFDKQWFTPSFLPALLEHHQISAHHLARRVKQLLKGDDCK